jgi:hypothetical protein
MKKTPKTTTVEEFLALDRALVAKGFPATSPWWKDVVTRFYRGGKRTAVLRCGRRSGKSSTLARVACVEAMSPAHRVTPGDVGVVAFISISRDESAQRIRTVKAILDAINVEYRPIEYGIELVDRPIAIKTYAASVAGVVGATIVCAVCDEVARWQDKDTGANPATQVLQSLRPALVSMPSAKLWLSSSAFGLEDAHARAVADGNTPMQDVFEGTTWECNPTISIEMTEALEPDPKVRLREFGNVPSAETSSCFTAEDVAKIFVPISPTAKFYRGQRICVLDPSAASLRGDGFGIGVASYLIGVNKEFRTKRVYLGAEAGWIYDLELDADGKPIELTDEERSPPRVQIEALGTMRRGMSADEIVATIVATCRKYDCRVVVSDQHEQTFLGAGIERAGLTFIPKAWTNQTKNAAVRRCRRWMADGRLAVDANAHLRKQLLGFVERVTPSGLLTFGNGRGVAHDDLVSVVLLCCRAEEDGLLPMSPERHRFNPYYLWPGFVA